MNELLETGVVLMAAGMGTVFVLLTVLVFIVQGVSKVSGWIEPRRGAPVAVAPVPPPAEHTADTEIVTIIGAAIAAYRRDQDAER
jgi:oxaloacetate decarboxylase (Na+ extruding) subunit gamma